MSNLTAANQARIAKQLTATVALSDGRYISIERGIAEGVLAGLYYRPFQTRKDSYGIVEKDQPGFFDIPKMLHDYLAEQGMERYIWGA